MQMRNTRRGFTLMELLVAVLITGILAAIAIPQYQVAVEKSRAIEAVLMLKNARDAYELWELNNASSEVEPSNVVDWGNENWSDSGSVFCTHYFQYEFAGPDIAAFRADSTNTPCGTADSSIYKINIEGTFSGGNNMTFCEAYNDLGYKVCNSLRAYGFAVFDERKEK